MATPGLVYSGGGMGRCWGKDGRVMLAVELVVGDPAARF